MCFWKEKGRKRVNVAGKNIISVFFLKDLINLKNTRKRMLAYYSG